LFFSGYSPSRKVIVKDAHKNLSIDLFYSVFTSSSISLQNGAGSYSVNPPHTLGTVEKVLNGTLCNLCAPLPPWRDKLCKFLTYCCTEIHREYTESCRERKDRLFNFFNFSFNREIYFNKEAVSKVCFNHPVMTLRA